MKAFSIPIVCAGMLCLSASVASADTVRVTKYVSEYVWDEVPVRGVIGDAPSGWGGQSWQGPETGKTNFYLTTAEMMAAFGTDMIQLGSIAKISFNTKRDSGDETDGLFFLNIYTIPTGSDDSSSWYKSRLTLNPVEGTQINDVWQLWSSDDSESSNTQLRIRDTNRFSSTGEVGPWTIESRDYSSEYYGALAIGTNSLDFGNNTYIDGITITLTNGDVGEFDMQVIIPLPSASGLAGLGLLCLGLRRRRTTL